MNKEMIIDEASSFYNLPRAEVESTFDCLIDAFPDVLSAFGDLVQKLSDMINEVIESIQAIKEEKPEFTCTGKPMSLKEFLFLISKAHQISLEEEKKPPDQQSPAQKSTKDRK